VTPTIIHPTALWSEEALGRERTDACHFQADHASHAVFGRNAVKSGGELALQSQSQRMLPVMNPGVAERESSPSRPVRQGNMEGMQRLRLSSQQSGPAQPKRAVRSQPVRSLFPPPNIRKSCMRSASSQCRV
jgi:hypothetical protein